MELKTIPLLDNYETTLAQEWDGQVGKIKVDELPSVPVNSENKFENGFTTYIIVNPDKANFQLAEIDGYDVINKTLNVINVDLPKGLGVNYNQVHHNQKSIVRISNNFAFWKKLSDILNNKADFGDGTVDNNGQDYFLNVVNGNLKFKDKDNVEISLSELASKSGQDKKVSITGEDEAKFLQEKIGNSLKIIGTGENRKIDVDFANIDLSQIQEENLSENTFVLTDNKKKTRLSKNIFFKKFVLGENLKKGDLVEVGEDGRVVKLKKGLKLNTTIHTMPGSSYYYEYRKFYTYKLGDDFAFVDFDYKSGDRSSDISNSKKLVFLRNSKIFNISFYNIIKLRENKFAFLYNNRIYIKKFDYKIEDFIDIKNFQCNSIAYLINENKALAANSRYFDIFENNRSNRLNGTSPGDIKLIYSFDENNGCFIYKIENIFYLAKYTISGNNIVFSNMIQIQIDNLDNFSIYDGNNESFCFSNGIGNYKVTFKNNSFTFVNIGDYRLSSRVDSSDNLNFFKNKTVSFPDYDVYLDTSRERPYSLFLSKETYFYNNFLGILQENGNTGEQKPIAMFGDISDIHSGLNIGENFVYGKAISENEILLFKNN